MISSLSVLETDFCPPLDPALVYAIYHDFEGSDTEKLQQAREILEQIKESALVEQGLEFDPSGSSVAKDRSILSSDTGDVSTSSDVLRSDGSEITAISRGLSSLEFGENPRSTSSGSTDGTLDFENKGFLDDVEALDTATKEARLVETFPTLKVSAITLTLRKCNNSFARATDELLNQVYFESSEGEEKISNRSIDAFFTDDTNVRGRKKKGKKSRRSKALYGSSTDGSPSPDEEAPANKWQSGSDAVGFLSSRMNIPVSTVSSVYHKSGASVPRTIQALLDVDIKFHEEDHEADTTQVTNALELHTEFPSIDPVYALALIRTSHPSTAAAHQLAKAFTHQPSTTRSAGGIQLIPRYAPIDISSSEPPLSPSSSSSRTTNSTSTSSLHSARNSAFTQATAAYRRGKSDPLMRAAAGYYSQVGRDHDAAYKAALAADADALVAAQSSSSQLDLHGVSVRDATRITREKVTAWWHGLGDARYGRGERPGVGSGYRIITGKGTHSEGGMGRLGPAVGRMLVREGWKVEVGSGVLVVTGVAKRK